MAMIVVPRRVPWRRKPPSLPRVNWGNPITKDLVAAVYLKGGRAFDLVQSREWTPQTSSIESSAHVTLGPTSRQTANTSKGFQSPSLEIYRPTTITVQCLLAPQSFNSFNTMFTVSGLSYKRHVFVQSVSSTSIEYLVNNNAHSYAPSGGLVAGESHSYLAIYNQSTGTKKLWMDTDLVINVTDVHTILLDGGYPRIGGVDNLSNRDFVGHQSLFFIWAREMPDVEAEEQGGNPYKIFAPRTQNIFIPSGGALSLSSAATLRDSDKPIAMQQKAVSVDALIRAADLLIGTPQKSISVDALLADADKLSTVSRHEATLAAQLLDGDVAIASAQKSGSIPSLMQDADKATGITRKAALVTGLLLDGDLLTALGSQIETHLSAGVLSGADVLIAGVTTNRTVAGKAQDGDELTVASAIDRLSAALCIDPETLTGAATSARSIGALVVEGDAAVAGIQSGRLQPALLIDGDILIITSSTVAQADLAGRINLSGRYAPQVSLVGVYAPAINLKGRVH